MSEKIIERSPTRIDFAGGTLDCWPLYMFVDGATTVNLAIDIYTECELQLREDSEIHLKSIDQNWQSSFRNLSNFFEKGEDKWCLLKEHLAFWQKGGQLGDDLGFELATNSASPAGGGLGGSSSLSISLLRAFEKLTQSQIQKSDLAPIAGNLEARILHNLTGCQDYYPAVNGGLNIIHLEAGGVEVEVLPPPTEELNQHFFVVYTGKPHHSGINNWSIIKAAVEKNREVMGALFHLKEVAEEAEKICRRSEWSSFGELLNEEYLARIQLSPKVLCEEINRLKFVACESGAQAVKICGAGGGGCVIVWSQPEKLESVKEAVSEAGFQILPAKPVGTNSQSWN